MAKAPVSLKLIQSFGLSTMQARANSALRCACSHCSLNAHQATEGGLPATGSSARQCVARMKRSTSARLRLSFQSGTASTAGSPSASTSTVACIWPQAPTAAIRAAAPGRASSTRRITATAPFHQSAGRCSDHPYCGTICSCSCAAKATVSPAPSSRATRTLPVPTSIASSRSRAIIVVTRGAARRRIAAAPRPG